MRTKTLLGYASAVEIYSMNKMKDFLVNKEAKPNHIQGLQNRLDYIARKATYTGNRKQTGSTLPYAQVAKRAKVRGKDNLRKQFAGEVDSKGINSLYLKDGFYVAR